MLIELFGKNFGCFRDEFRLSLLATDIDPESQRGIVEVNVEGDDEPLRLLRAIALYGANASGKSTVLQAAGTISDLLSVTPRLASDSPLSSYEPFKLDSETRHKATTLGATAVIDGQVYEYTIAFDERAFSIEQLTHILPDGARNSLIDRSAQEVSGGWKDDPQFELVTREFRANALLLALADALAPGLAKGIAVGFRNLLRHTNPYSSPFSMLRAGTHGAELAQRNSAFKEWLLARLRTADIGVVGVKPQEKGLRAVDQLLDHYELLWNRESRSTDPEAILLKRSPRGRFRLSLLHSTAGEPVPLNYERESLGTQRLVEWSPLLYQLTHEEKPIAAFVDEFDASMHPMLLESLVRHFNCEISAREARGQLVFTTHETSLLDDEAKDAVLRRDQVYLTEKDPHGASRLFSVADFKERNNLNLRRRYLQGRYGAVPSLGDFAEKFGASA